MRWLRENWWLHHKKEATQKKEQRLLEKNKSSVICLVLSKVWVKSEFTPEKIKRSNLQDPLHLNTMSKFYTGIRNIRYSIAVDIIFILLRKTSIVKSFVPSIILVSSLQKETLAQRMMTITFCLIYTKLMKLK